jgi:hypothetical protein
VQSPDEPQTLNRYTYVLNNPQGYIDPTGYEGQDTGGSYSIPLRKGSNLLLRVIGFC